jgi:hypothetical protein
MHFVLYLPILWGVHHTLRQSVCVCVRARVF